MKSNQPKLEQLGPLQVLKVKGKESSPTVILFHGFGASAFDLFPLHETILPELELNWIFPNGHLEIPLGPGYTGYAWFPIDMEALQRAMMKSTFRDFSEMTPAGLDLARENAEKMIAELGIPHSSLIIGGFSQGAMLSTEICFQSSNLTKGLILLSGTLLHREIWKDLAKTKSRLTFFQSHGKQDLVLGFKAAKELNTLLRDAGMVGEFIEFQGGHEIPMEVLAGVSRYILTLI